MEGFVTKRGHLITNWKVRWFQLENAEIKYYTDKTRQVLRGRYILRKESIVSPHADMGLNKNILLIFTSSNPFRKRALYFSCDSEESKNAWQSALTRQIEGLKAGKLAPAVKPTIIESTMQQMDNVASMINDTITGAVSKVRTTVEVVTGDSSTNDADVEELLRGRPTPRLNRIERADPEPGEPGQAGAASRNARKRLSAHPSAVGSGVGAEWEKNSTYTAADYDSSDTDGSADEHFAPHRPASRVNSVGNHSGQSAALAAEALNSPLFKKRVSGGPHGKGTVAVDESELPRVSILVAEEAAASAYTRKAGTMRTQRPEAPSPVARPISSGDKTGGRAHSPVPSASPKEDSSSTPRKKSFTADDKSWIKPTQAAGVDPRSGGDSAAGISPQAERSAAVSSMSGKQGGSGASPGEGTERSMKGTPDRAAGANAPAAAGGEAEAEADNPWVQAYTAEGELYYYHKVTRLARWDKPEAHVREAVESRMRDLDLATERSLRERREEMERAKQRERENEQIKDEKTGEIERTVQRWAMDKQRAGRELSFPELLRDLVFVLPSDLLLLLYESNHRSILDALQEFSLTSPSPPEVKKAYLRVVRFVHPDKLPQEIETASKLLVERVFIHLTQKYDLYRKAHDLG